MTFLCHRIFCCYRVCAAFFSSDFLEFSVKYPRYPPAIRLLICPAQTRAETAQISFKNCSATCLYSIWWKKSHKSPGNCPKCRHYRQTALAKSLKKTSDSSAGSFHSQRAAVTAVTFSIVFENKNRCPNDLFISNLTPKLFSSMPC